MGTDAKVFIFDYVTYSTAVVPAFSALLRGEQPVDWLQPFIERRDLKPWLWDKQDLSRYSAALNPDITPVVISDNFWSSCPKARSSPCAK